MQNILTKKRIRNFNLFLLRREKIVYFILSFALLFLIFSYTYFVASSTFKIYSISESKNILAKNISENAKAELDYYLLKEKIKNNFSGKLVVAKNIQYVDSTLQALVYAKK